jgi:hypothetical protein
MGGYVGGSGPPERRGGKHSAAILGRIYSPSNRGAHPYGAHSCMHTALWLAKSHWAATTGCQLVPILEAGAARKGLHTTACILVACRGQIRLSRVVDRRFLKCSRHTPVFIFSLSAVVRRNGGTRTHRARSMLASVNALYTVRHMTLTCVCTPFGAGPAQRAGTHTNSTRATP